MSRDMRFVRTDKALIKALYQLLEEKDFDSITVNDICIEASISRTAFYLHFDDKYSLALRCFEALVKEIPDIPSKNIEDGIFAMLDAVYAKRKALKSFYSIGGNHELEQKLSQMLTQFYSEYYVRELQPCINETVPVTVAAMYHSAGMMKLFKWWIEGNCKEEKQEMANYILQLHDRGIRAICK